MQLRDYFSVLRARWLIIAGCVLLALLAAGALGLRAPRVYEARTSVFFSVNVGNRSSELSRGFSYAQGLVSSYAQVATEPPVLAPVIAQLGLDTTPAKLAGSITAQAPLDTVIIDILVTDPSPEQAAAIANATARQLGAVVTRDVPRASNAVAPVRVTVVSPAAVPSSPSSPRLALNLTVAAIVGLLGGVVLAFARDILDPRIGSQRDVSRITDVPVIGLVARPVPVLHRRRMRRRIRASDEQVKELRTNFQHVRVARRLRSVVFTSANEEAPSSLTVARLGLELAHAGVLTLVVDADLRKPSLSERFKVEDVPGLSSVLIGLTHWQDAVQHRGPLPLYTLSAGPMSHDPSVMFNPDAVGALLTELSESFDVVLVKAPPVLRVADGLLLARIADGAVIVTDEPNMNRGALTEEIRVLRIADAELLGIVLTT